MQSKSASRPAPTATPSRTSRATEGGRARRGVLYSDPFPAWAFFAGARAREAARREDAAERVVTFVTGVLEDPVSDAGQGYSPSGWLQVDGRRS